ncbi:MAG TPA: VOC family protein [Streptosporangiaceae bacterium]|nr:VOC family protein [Streptosporangiaceae bacterium]
MPRICGFHHVSLAATDLDRTADWYERVFGFEPVLIEEDEECIRLIVLRHPDGMLLQLCRPAQLALAVQPSGGAAILSFRVASQDDLVAWAERLTGLGVSHSGPRTAHLGWALDVIDPSGLHIQLHTYEVISSDGS